MDLLRLINEATTPKDSNAGISTVPTTINVSETTSSGTYANENAPSGFQKSTTPSGSSGTSTLTFENAHIQLPGSSTHGGNRSVMTKPTNEANDLLEVEPINKKRLDFIASSLNEKLNLVKTSDEEIIENCAVDEIETEILESDEVN